MSAPPPAPQLASTPSARSDLDELLVARAEVTDEIALREGDGVGRARVYVGALSAAALSLAG